MDLNFVSALKNLNNPFYYLEPVNIFGVKKDILLAALKTMLLIRFTEEEIANLIRDGFIFTPCHLGIGQEAVAAGVSLCLMNDDKVLSCHRSHAHFIAKGCSVYSLLAEVMGKASGASKGMGGSMHLIDQSRGFYGSVPIVGATIPIAVGVALAEKMKKSNYIAVAYFGDGACEEGVLHESLNLASLYNLPILFVCENNLFASHMDINLRQPTDSVARYAKANCIEHAVVDGNNIMHVMQATRLLVDKMRAGSGPGFLEAITFRWLGHVGPQEDIDVGIARKIEDVNAWKKRDPIARLVQALQIADMLTQDEYQDMINQVRFEVSQAAEQAKIADYPSEKQLLDLVYKV